MSEQRARAADKRNYYKIRSAIRQPILKKLFEIRFKGGVLSLLDDSQIADLSDVVTREVMNNEHIRVSVKRSSHYG